MKGSIKGLRRYVLWLSCLLSVFINMNSVSVNCSDVMTTSNPASSSLLVWANDGGDKVPREDLRAAGDPAGVCSSIWDGQKISLFGARNEVVGFNLILEAPGDEQQGLTVDFNRLSGPNGTSICSTSRVLPGYRHHHLQRV